MLNEPSEEPKRYFFRPNQRLLSKHNYSNVFDNCLYRASKGPILMLALPNQLKHPRLGLVVRKKFIKKAVDRNQFKRIVRETFRLHQHDLPDIDIVVMNRAGSDRLPAPQLNQLVVKTFYALAKQANKTPL